MNKKQNRQPIGIIINTAVLIIGGIITILTAIGLSVMGSLGIFTDVFPIVSVFAAIAFLLLILGIAMILLGYALWLHNPAAWWIIFIIIGIGLIGDIISWIMGYPDFIGIVFSLILFLGLIHEKTIKAVKPDINWEGWKTP